MNRKLTAFVLMSVFMVFLNAYICFAMEGLNAYFSGDETVHSGEEAKIYVTAEIPANTHIQGIQLDFGYSEDFPKIDLEKSVITENTTGWRMAGITGKNLLTVGFAPKDKSKIEGVLVFKIPENADKAQYTVYFADTTAATTEGEGLKFNLINDRFTIKVSDSESDITTEKDTYTETTTAISIQGRPSGGSGGGGNYIKDTANTVTETSTAEEQTETTTEEKVISNDVRVSIGSSIITVGNKKYNIDAAPYIQPKSNSTLVPLRFAAIAISGGDVGNADNSSVVGWNADTKTASVKAGGNVIKFTAGSELMYIGNTPVVMENGVKAEINNNRMFIPFRALGKALGVRVDWDANTKTAIYSVK